MPREVERGARWAEPELVGEVRFADWNGDGVLGTRPGAASPGQGGRAGETGVITSGRRVAPSAASQGSVAGSGRGLGRGRGLGHGLGPGLLGEQVAATVFDPAPPCGRRGGQAAPGPQVDGGGEHAREDGQEHQPVVDQGDEYRTGRDRDGLRSAGQRLGRGGDPAEQRLGCAALQSGGEPDHEQRDPHTADGLAREHAGSRARTHRPLPIPNAASPIAVAASSPRRPMSRAATGRRRCNRRPGRTASTPMNSGGRCRPWSTTAKDTDSVRPMTSQAMAPAVIMRRSAGSPIRCRRPAVISSRSFGSARSGGCSSEPHQGDGDGRGEEGDRVDRRDGGAAHGVNSAAPAERADQAQPLGTVRNAPLRGGQHLVGQQLLEQAVERGASWRREIPYSAATR